MKKRIVAIPVLCLFLFSMSACDDKLDEISKYMLVVSKVNLELSESVEVWYNAGLINAETGDVIMEVVKSVSVAGIQIDAILRRLEESDIELDFESVSTLIEILRILSDEIDPANLPFLDRLTNMEVKQTTLTKFIGMRTAIGSAMVILANME